MYAIHRTLSTLCHHHLRQHTKLFTFNVQSCYLSLSHSSFKLQVESEFSWQFIQQIFLSNIIAQSRPTTAYSLSEINYAHFCKSNKKKFYFFILKICQNEVSVLFIETFVPRLLYVNNYNVAQCVRLKINYVYFMVYNKL